VGCGEIHLFKIPSLFLNHRPLLFLCHFNKLSMIIYSWTQLQQFQFMWHHAYCIRCSVVETSWNVMAQVQKPVFVFQRNRRVHLNRQGRQFSRLLAAEVCASAIVMLDTPCSEVVWRVLATHCICQFPLHFPSRASQCAITFKLESAN